jgi:hypothetical protein
MMILLLTSLAAMDRSSPWMKLHRPFSVLCDYITRQGCKIDLDATTDPQGDGGAVLCKAATGNRSCDVPTHTLRALLSTCPGAMRWRRSKLGPSYWPGNADGVFTARWINGRRYGWCLAAAGLPRRARSNDTQLIATHTFLIDLEATRPSCGTSVGDPFMVLAIRPEKGLPSELMVPSRLPPSEPGGHPKGRALLGLVERLLGVREHRQFERATNSSFTVMMRLLAQQSDAFVEMALNSEARLLDDKHIDDHSLNRAGLTALRKLVFEQALVARRAVYRRRHASLYPELEADAKAWDETGMLLLYHFNASKLEQRQRLLNVLRTITASPELKLPCRHGRKNKCAEPACCDDTSWLISNHIVHDTHEGTYDMHVDCLVPSIKMWIYPNGVGTSEGPFHYVNGSHISTVEKLRWLHAKSQPPAHSFVGCLAPRTELRDDRISELGYQTMTPMAPLLPNTVLIADTSGVHRRGRAHPGTARTAYSLRFPPIYAIPRTYMLPFTHPFKEHTVALFD